VAFNLHNWTTDKEAELKWEFKQVNFVYLESTRKKLFQWLFSSLLERFSRKCLSLFPTNSYWQSLAVSKRSWILLQWANGWKGNPDLIIAHNPAALFPAFKLSLRLGIPFALDIEDYHPGESNSKVECNAIRHLMQELIPKAAYVSYASPLIKKQSEGLLTNQKPKNGILVNNFFYSEYFCMPTENLNMDSKLKILWFSQIIDYKRGLEDVLPVLDLYKEEISLTLIGNMNPEFHSAEVKHRGYISCISALSQKKLNQELISYDVGLAIEPGRDLNNRLALSNKILAYFQSGLYIIASTTKGQQLFMEQHPFHGICSTLNFNEFRETISFVLKNRVTIRSQKRERYLKASNLNWENESKALSEKWKQIIGS
jgi:glycosyltransferase involved in cell wall biosynthesis